jgi:hypothetical protein
MRLIKVWFPASTFVLEIATFAKPETVPMAQFRSPFRRNHFPDTLAQHFLSETRHRVRLLPRHLLEAHASRFGSGCHHCCAD